jgi:hypothetical protein
MAGIKPSFITGASAKITVGGKTFAYAADVSYSIAVDTIPIETMGRYEAVTNEPVNYSVAGELSIVRYTNVASGSQDTNPFGTAAGTGNGVAASGLQGFFDPAAILASKSVDIVIYQKKAANVTTGSDAATSSAVDTVRIGRITDARMNRLSGGINKRGILVERMSFVGILFDGDDFDAGKSADTDLS